MRFAISSPPRSANRSYQAPGSNAPGLMRRSLYMLTMALGLFFMVQPSLVRAADEGDADTTAEGESSWLDEAIALLGFIETTGSDAVSSLTEKDDRMGDETDPGG